MKTRSRREFLFSVGQGMFVAGVGAGMAVDLGLSPAVADDDPKRISFGSLEPLVSMMQETPLDKFLPVLTSKLREGTELKQLVAAAALANARAFGGEDYVGFHTLMALAPSYMMSQQLPEERRALPVLKVLYRNTARLHARGGHDVLKPIDPIEIAANGSTADLLRETVHQKDTQRAERTLAALVERSPDGAFNDLMEVVEEGPEVHRIVLAYRAWDMLGLVGQDHASTMLRQSLRFCLRAEDNRIKYFSGSGPVLAKALDEHRLIGRPIGDKAADDAWIDRMSRTIFESSPEVAADAVAAALAEGMSLQSVGEAISVAANQLVLRDAGRPERETGPGKGLGSVHGDSIGVHACDSANAWRNISLVSNPRNAVASLILSAYQVARDRTTRGGNFLEWKPRPYAEHLEKITATEPDVLLRNLHGAIREQDQAMACAIVHRYGELGHDAEPVFGVLLEYATSEDGALHAEKYYSTVRDEFTATRKPLRGRQLVALARVTASEYGNRAPGYDEACRLLNVNRTAAG